MNKHDRMKLLKQGIAPLRAVYNQKGFWQMCRQTGKGGWAVISKMMFADREECNKAIIVMQELEPEKYVQDH